MEITVVIFLVVSFGSIIVSFLIEGGKLIGLYSITALLTVTGGTLGAVGVSFPEEIKNLPKLIVLAFKKSKSDIVDTLFTIKDISIKARKEGLLSLEEEISSNTKMDSFIKKGIMLSIDGLDSESLRDSLELELESLNKRHKNKIEIFETAGGYSPTMGIIGTVTGLVHVLSNLEDPTTLGPKIAVAFVATLYGVGFANLLWLPLAMTLKQKNNKEFREKSMIIEGITQIQEGVNPTFLFEKLKGFLSPEEVKLLQKKLEKPVATNVQVEE